MGFTKLEQTLLNELQELKTTGTAKGQEAVISGVKKASGSKGPRYLLEDRGDQEFIRMNSNSYLGIALDEALIEAEEKASREFGVGPGAVRFINGTFKPHRDLEKRLARFHNRAEAMIFSSAYATMIGVFNSLTTAETIIISDELNHNCIINAMRLSRPKDKKVYKHLNLEQLESRIKEAVSQAKRLLLITDGIFSMRGDYAPLDKISDLCKKYEPEFPEGIILMVDDSHGVGAFGQTGRGAEEYTHADRVDILIGTLGKAFGVNGGYVVAGKPIIDYLREKSVTYIYSNPITTGEAAATIKALDFVESAEGKKRLAHIRELTKRFKDGLKRLGFETLTGEHPIVPLLVRHTDKTTALVHFLLENGVLSTGIKYPVVPRGDEEIRFQVNGNHTALDIDTVLEILDRYKKKK